MPNFTGMVDFRISPVKPETTPESPSVSYLVTILEALESNARARGRKLKQEQLLQAMKGYLFLSAAPNFSPDLALHEFLRIPHRGSLLENFLDTFEMSTEAAASLLAVSEKTVRNRKRTEAELPSADVERIARYVRAWTAAANVFENHAYARTWLHAPCESLGGLVPVELLTSGDGERIVLDTLGRIEHGLPV